MPSARHTLQPVEGYLLLVDVAGSSRLKAAAAQAALGQLKRATHRLNRRHRDALKHSLTLDYGDEVAAFFNTPTPLYAVVRSLCHALHPHATLRFTAGFGELGRSGVPLREAGGTAFKQADRLLKQCKQSRRYCAWFLEDDRSNAALTSLCEMSHALVADMTSNQYEIYCLMEAGYSQTKIAAKRARSKQAISASVRASKAEMVIHAHEAIDLLLGDMAALHARKKTA